MRDISRHRFSMIILFVFFSLVQNSETVILFGERSFFSIDNRRYASLICEYNIYRIACESAQCKLTRPVLDIVLVLFPKAIMRTDHALIWMLSKINWTLSISIWLVVRKSNSADLSCECKSAQKCLTLRKLRSREIDIYKLPLHHLRLHGLVGWFCWFAQLEN